MGYSSYLCKHCNHGILNSDATTANINEWMSSVVMLAPNGSRLIESDYSGYEGDYERFSMNGSVWVHEACWELTGKPDFDAYEGPSPYDPKQGAGGPEAYIIDPRIKDEDERARLLAEGIERHKRFVLERKARNLADWLEQSELNYYREMHGGEMWRLRYSYFETYPHTEDGSVDRNAEKDGTWWHINDGLDFEHEAAAEERSFRGTEDELKAHLAATWAQFLESDECKALLTLRDEIEAKARIERMEELKVKGRYVVRYGPALQGDTVKDEFNGSWTSSRTVYQVEDELTYTIVAVMDGPNKALGVKTFVSDPVYTGNYSPKWEARVEAIRAARQKSRELAQAEAARLNAKWADEGYPMPEEWA